VHGHLRGFTIQWEFARHVLVRHVLRSPEKSRMYEITVEETFAAGHYLRNYRGKCENPHGHNYKVRITLAGDELDKAGLLLDFKEIKDAMRHVVDRLDHQMINELEPFVTLNPSAENLARYFYEQTNSRMQSATQGRVRVKDVTIWETDTTAATYFE
jgi:6-pyruvoyltetrahydropterin/6-carboxytetrahydropterin synthase